MKSNQELLNEYMNKINSLQQNFLLRLNKISPDTETLSNDTEIQKIYQEIFFMNEELRSRSHSLTTNLEKKDNTIKESRNIAQQKMLKYVHLNDQNQAMPTRHDEFREMVNDTYISIGLLVFGVIALLGGIYYVRFGRESYASFAKNRQSLMKKIKINEGRRGRKTKKPATKAKKAAEPIRPQSNDVPTQRVQFDFNINQNNANLKKAQPKQTRDVPKLPDL